MISVQVNGETHTFDSDMSVQALIEHLSLTGKRIAVEINEMIVPKSQHEATMLHSADRIEIVHAIGGG